MSKPVTVCCCHSDNSVDLKRSRNLEKHLAILIRTQQITFSHHTKIHTLQQEDITAALQLATADIILLLLSKHFFSSHSCYELMNFAIVQYVQRHATLIPIYLEDYDYEDSPVSQFKALPSNEKPIANWSNKDRAWKEIVRGIRSAIEKHYTFPVQTYLQKKTFTHFLFQAFNML